MTLEFKLYDGRVRPVALQADAESCLSACIADVAADLLDRQSAALEFQKELAKAFRPGGRDLKRGWELARKLFPSLAWEYLPMSLDDARSCASPQSGVVVGLLNVGGADGHAVRILGGSMPRVPGFIRQIRYFDPFPYGDQRTPVVDVNYQEVEARYVGAGGYALVGRPRSQ